MGVDEQIPDERFFPPRSLDVAEATLSSSFSFFDIAGMVKSKLRSFNSRRANCENAVKSRLRTDHRVRRHMI